MAILSYFDMKHSVSTRLFKIVFLLYLCIVAIVTIIHITTEYYYTKTQINEELDIYKNTFRRSLAGALWELDKTELQTIIKGMIEIPSISGIQIKDHNGEEELGKVGTVIDDNGRITFVKNVDIKIDSAPSDLPVDLFYNRFSIYYTHETGKHKVGEATIYSSSNVVFQKLKVGFFFLIVNSIIKSFFLWAIFLIVSTKILKKPLLKLTSTVRQLDFNNLKRMNIEKRRLDEIGVLEDVFDNAIIKLIGNREEIQKANQELEKHRDHLQQTVEEKTDTLRIKNKQLEENVAELKHAEKQIKASLKEKETLLHEIHHRVKNNLTVISSLLNLQARRANNKAAKAVLLDSKNRVQAMSMIHETLHRSDNLSSIDIGDYFSKLVTTIFQSYGNLQNRVILKIVTNNIKFDVKTATPLGLIVNELITNTLKYAYPENNTVKS